MYISDFLCRGVCMYDHLCGCMDGIGVDSWMDVCMDGVIGDCMNISIYESKPVRIA